MKRFWQQVTVAKDAAGRGAVLLDGKVMKTPAGKDFACPTLALADAVAEEWRAVKEKIDPQAMPMTQLAATALDLIPAQRDTVIDQIAAYANTDLLCYRASEPEALIVRQAATWQPYLDWATRQFDAMLRNTSGVRHIEQDPPVLKALRRAVAAHDDFALAALQNAVTTTGSLILGLALAHGWRDADAIFAAAELDANFQIERWGADDEAMARQVAVKQEIANAARFVQLMNIGATRPA